MDDSQVLEQRVEARTRELQALLDMSRSLSSTLELQEVLDSILDHLRVLVNCAGASVLLREGDDLVQLAVRRPAYVGPVDQQAARSAAESYSLIWQTIERGDEVIIDDVRGTSPLAEAYQRHVGYDLALTPLRYIRAWAAVPLSVRDNVIGMLAMAHEQPAGFVERDIELARAVASQAAVAIDNARLFAREAQRSRELSTLLDVSLNAAASIELQPLLDLVLGELRGVVPHDRVAIQTYENGYLTVLAARDASPAGAKAQERDGYQVQVSDDFFATQFPDRMPAIIDDILDESELAREYRASAHPHINSGLVPHGSYMAIPLMSRDHAVGLLTVMRDQPGFYTEDHARLGRAIGSQIAIAVDRARLFEETRRSARETETLVRADAELFRSLQLDTVLQALVDVAVDVLGADKSIVLLHEGDIDVVKATRNYTSTTIADFNRRLAAMPHEEPPPEGRQPQIYNDLSDAPAFVAEALSREQIVSHISLPVRDTKRMLGVFGVGFLQPHVFSDDEKRLYTALADRAAVAIQNAELYERAQHAASLEERQRLARELHDSVSQALYGIALGARTARLRIDEDPARAAEPIDYVSTLAEAGLAEMRALIFELRPESLETEGLVVAIEKQIASTRARHQLKIEADLVSEPDCRLEVKEALYRIAQEALNNVVKHAQAANILVRLAREDGALLLTVQDDGRGFDASAAYPGHIGLLSMPERAAKLGGAVTIESAPGSGTRVDARVPL